MPMTFAEPKTHRRGITSLVKAFASVWLVVAMTNPCIADDHDFEDWIKDSLTGDYQDQQFVAGERVDVSNATVGDDIFAAGGDLEFDNVSAKLIIAAGASLSFRNVTADDLILAGGEIDLSGAVTDDVVAAVCPFCPVGGRLHVMSSMLIGDDARLAGREIVVDGRVGGDLYAAGQYFELSGTVAGDARIAAESIVLESGARIEGDLRYAGPEPPELHDGAVVAGKIIEVDSPIPFDEEVPEHPVWIGIFAVLGFLAALILLGVVLQLAVPGVLSRAAATVRASLWASLGRGLVLALLGPAAIMFLMMTIIGAPIGLICMAALVLLYALAFATTSFSIGLYVRRLFGNVNDILRPWPRILWTVAGILILIVVGLIPFVGWAFGILAVFAGLGAVTSQLGPVFARAAD